MNADNPSTEIKAYLALNDLERRERLLRIVKGKGRWRYYVFGCLWSGVIIWLVANGNRENVGFLVLLPLGWVMVAVCEDFSQRINSLIELIGEERLKKAEPTP